jgi:hypothetical protein
MEGISNAVWGPVYWKMFHYVTLSYPLSPLPIHMEKIKYFFCELVPYILPCHICRNHYRKNLELNPLTDDILKIKFKLVIWLLDMHNYVNKQLGKNQISYEDALVSLFFSESLKMKENNEVNKEHYEKKKELYDKNKFRELFEKTSYIPFNDDLILNIDDVIKHKEKELENENININKTEKIVKNENISDIQLIGQKTINMNIIMDKILNHINSCDNDREKYLIYTGFETICFIFS